MKINRYKLKPDVTKEQLKSEGFREGGCWIYPDCELFKFIGLKDRIELNIGFGGVKQWNDYDNILILDDDFGQPYTPFYADENYDKEVSGFDFLEKVISKYNDVMDGLSFLERI